MRNKYKTPHNSRGMPQIATHNYSSVRDMLPDMTSSEKSNTGIVPLKGKMTASYPVINGLNSAGKGMMQQPLVTHTGFDQKKYL